MNLDEVDAIPPIFFPSEIDSDRRIFYPIARHSSEFDCMVGYFTSGVLAELATTIASYLQTESSVLRFVISPQLNEKDFVAIINAYNDEKSFFNILFPDLKFDENSLRTYTVAALSSLISQKRIQLRVALKKDGIFHAKAWFFQTPKGGVVIHGSSNATQGGLSANFEQLVVSREWSSQESKEVFNQLRNKFDALWNDNLHGLRTIPVNKSTMTEIKKISNLYRKPIEQFKAAYEPPLTDEYTEENKANSLIIPEYINYKEGPFKHQGEAVDSWLKNGKKGILSIATGGGKTITSLIAASKLLESSEHLLITIAVPTKALMRQWEEDVQKFGIDPINTSGKGTKVIAGDLKKCFRNLRLKINPVEIIIVTYNALFSGIFNIDERVKGKAHSLLIADEVHNIGSENSQDNFPSMFDFKIGLSATHERQYDEDGTEFIKKEFGEVVYEYGLDKAIGSCLVPFKYYAYFVYLTAEEEDDFQELTEKIRKLSFAANSEGNNEAKDRWQQLCIKRRSLIESAQNKIDCLFDVFPEESDLVSKTLIFCTDKNPSQLNSVNAELNKKKINFHQVTAQETSSSKLLNTIVQAFSKDELQVLTSKRVLDEGFNIPQIEKAYILASNTVRRQWTQRLGRVLRMSEGTGKTHADIYDFIVVPQVVGKVDDDLKSLLEGEYSRVEFFSRYSSNYMSKHGGYYASQKILENLKGES